MEGSFAESVCSHKEFDEFARKENSLKFGDYIFGRVVMDLELWKHHHVRIVGGYEQLEERYLDSIDATLCNEPSACQSEGQPGLVESTLK